MPAQGMSCARPRGTEVSMSRRPPRKSSRGAGLRHALCSSSLAILRAQRRLELRQPLAQPPVLGLERAHPVGLLRRGPVLSALVRPRRALPPVVGALGRIGRRARGAHRVGQWCHALLVQVLVDPVRLLVVLVRRLLILPCQPHRLLGEHPVHRGHGRRRRPLHLVLVHVAVGVQQVLRGVARRLGHLDDAVLPAPLALLGLARPLLRGGGRRLRPLLLLLLLQHPVLPVHLGEGLVGPVLPLPHPLPRLVHDRDARLHRICPWLLSHWGAAPLQHRTPSRRHLRSRGARPRPGGRGGISGGAGLQGLLPSGRLPGDLGGPGCFLLLFFLTTPPV
mmetsp:Transcript_22573/g.55656  ORF Transcript_22573/g.55656 Transcript_22573/m.55656 type:complete len:335 (-) Transcript_22573:51-1055(-)